MTNMKPEEPTLEERHANMVQALCKPGEALVEEITPLKANLNHMVIGLAGEVGELADVLKQFTIYNKPEIDRAHAVEELGDMEFYSAEIRAALGITREEVLAANLAKLEKRYNKGRYTDKDAEVRADKAEEDTE